MVESVRLCCVGMSQGKSVVLGPEIVQQTIEKIKMIQERMKES